MEAHKNFRLVNLVLNQTIRLTLRPGITDEDVDNMTHSRGSLNLYTYKSNVNQPGKVLENCAELPQNLRDITVHESPISEGGFGHLKALKNLEVPQCCSLI